MTSNELMTFATRVLERALQKAGYAPEPAVDPDAVPNPGDMFVDAVADKVIGFVRRADTVAVPQLQAAIESPALDHFRTRNAQLALALGACDCFGEDLSCPRCDGAGSPGWRLPDRPHFEAIVRPALQKVTQVRLAAGNGHSYSRQR